MAGPQKTRGFTLVELLVVITIIGMLMALLLPAIQSAREAGRKNTCANNMRNDAFAVMQVSESKKAFPGYATTIEKTNPSVGTHLVSWVVAILPNLERSDIYQNWMNPGYALNPITPTAGEFAPNDGSAANTQARQSYFSQISVLVCPSNSNPDLGDNPLSYVVNTGSAMHASDNASTTYLWPEDGNSGVCFNQAMLFPSTGVWSGSPKKIGIDFLNTNDGTSHTVLMSENLQAGNWATGPNDNKRPFQTDFAVRANVGFVWYVTGQINNVLPPTTQGTNNANYVAEAIGINSASKFVSGLPKGTYDASNTTSPTGLAYARPSSNHPGGVNMMFCDNHLQFINEEIGYNVYTQLMTPLQKRVIVDYTTSGNKPVVSSQMPFPASGMLKNKVLGPWLYTLNEADYN